MKNFPNVSVLIPARGGSQRIPGKNLLKLGGMPLVNISVLQAEALFPGSPVFVSTDSEEIKSHLWCKIINRPVEFATNTATTQSVIRHALPFIDTEYIALFQPTNPFRDLRRLREQLGETDMKNYDSLFSAFPFHGFTYTETGKRTNAPNRIRSQDQEKLYKEDGAFYLFSRDVGRHDDWIFGRVKVLDGTDMPDINTPDDFFNASRSWSPEWLTC
jgi:N-acylneuraminate cytidylyltransferase